MRTLRANFCTVPYGVGYLPIPRPEPYRLVVGEPISFPQVAKPTDDMINAVHRKYYKAVRALFDEYKERCDHGDDVIVVHPDVMDIGEKEWEHTIVAMRKAHDSEDSALHVLKPIAVGVLDLFQTHEGIWVLAFMILVFSVILVRAWSKLDFFGLV